MQKKNNNLWDAVMNKDSVKKRYRRNISSISPQEQTQLLTSKVCIIGLGGLGGGVAEMLTRIGVGHLVLVDGDDFDETNLNRQLLSTEASIGSSKADMAVRRVKEINSDVKTTLYKAFLTQDTATDMIKGCDVVVDCLDSIDDRFLLQDAARARSIPLVSGAIAGTSGQATTIFPDDRGFDLIYGQREEGNRRRGGETSLGNLSFCAMFVASIQVSETIKVLLNRGEMLRNRLLIVDMMSNSYEVMTLI